MRIVYVITRADAVGGATIHVRDMAAAMLARGHEAEVLVGGEGPVTEQLRDRGVPYTPLSQLRRAILPLQDLRAVEEMAAVLRKKKPDLVSTHTAKAGFVGRAACARLHLPAVYTPHGWSIGDRISSLLGPIFTLAERRAAKWCQRIVCVSDSEKRLAIAKRIAPEEKLVLVYNGMPDVPESLRADPSRHPPRICFVGRLEAPKDHETLLRALSGLTALPWELDLVGDGPLEGEIRSLAETLGLTARVHFLGYMPHPAEALARAQIFVLASRSEAFPRSILEAMRAGLPVVASDVGGVSEAVNHKESGLLVSPGDPGALAGALKKLLESAAARQLQGSAGRLLYGDRFGFDRMVEETLAVYATVLDSPGFRQRND